MKARLVAALMLAGACRPASPVPAGSSPTGEPAAVTVHDVLTSPALVGRTVQVSGRCLGYRVPPVALGNPPISRSDWQLADQGEAVYVNGALPDGCTATEGSASPSTITALVAQDTLPALGQRSGTPRRYLRRSD